MQRETLSFELVCAGALRIVAMRAPIRGRREWPTVSSTHAGLFAAEHAPTNSRHFFGRTQPTRPASQPQCGRGTSTAPRAPCLLARSRLTAARLAPHTEPARARRGPSAGRATIRATHGGPHGHTRCRTDTMVCSEHHSHSTRPSNGACHGLVRCRQFFQQCESCPPGSCAKAQDLLLKYYCLDCRVPLCCGCRSQHATHDVLQVRRSSYREVIKAKELARVTDTSGIQTYVINSNKVIFIHFRHQAHPPKGLKPPANCVNCSRQLLDAQAQFCSLQCCMDARSDGDEKPRGTLPGSPVSDNERGHSSMNETCTVSEEVSRDVSYAALPIDGAAHLETKFEALPTPKRRSRADKYSASPSPKRRKASAPMRAII
ncbi:unnamed protein product [Pedinophyceae sp. YPF-701]|nr:unnamed protein product [Pedinophyceae sp. YPF-701]